MTYRILTSLIVALGSATADADYTLVPFNHSNPDTLRTTAVAINDAGHVIGSYTYVSNGATVRSGYRYADGQFTDINYPGAGTQCLADVNASGQITGSWGSAASGCIHSFVFDGAQFTSFDVPGAYTTRAHGMNDFGEIAGQYWATPQMPSNDPEAHGFITNAGGFVTLDYPGAYFTEPYAINNSGEVAGTWVHQSSGRHGFVWKGGVFTPFDHPAAGNNSYNEGTYAFDMNNAGHVVGYFSRYGANGFEYIGYVRANGRYANVQIPGTPVEILSINDDGIILVATNFFSSSTRQSFIGYPEDPDGDGLDESLDNCTGIANADQLDADGDGYGNGCDADLNNSGLTTAVDFNLLRSCLNQPASASALCAAADMNGSGLVTSTDFSLMRARINTAPGPSGLHP